ncbi:MAG: response regulator [Gammaproteobacteria bacterium]|nr:response regulator [Gammaproteobacteria bacterium]
MVDGQGDQNLTGKENSISANANILYIEDNLDNRVVMEALIKKSLGIDIRTANDAEQGLKMCQESLPDLILMDIRLPGMDGVDAIKLLKNQSETRDIPIIAVSADAMEDNIEYAIKAGADEYITKPFDIENVVSTIVRLSGGQIQN